MHVEGKSFCCDAHHTYDIAKGGYVNLVLNHRQMSGDDKGMVDARSKFLAHGYYASLQQALCEIIQSISPEVLVDAGCGQGYYTNAFQDVMDGEIYGFDLSKFALKEACKAHKNIQYATASVADVPLLKDCADAWVSVFAPIYIEEVQRILKQDGTFIKVGPGAKHLYELKQVLYSEVYENEVEITSYEGFTHVMQKQVKASITIEHQDDIQALFQMTPYYYRSSKESIASLTRLETLKTQLEFVIDVYKKG